ncbi:MAG: Lrp/AsnC family transcriptional regulator [Gammaproteobacteria bacterium]|nr:Lrp/AsnC family transcriptional regulator [Gammaproteobacteria bacterium]
MKLDRIDKRILAQLQRNADQPLIKLAEQVGLSKNPCWRRIQRLQEAGVIRSRVALLDAAALNLDVIVFMNIRTNQHSAEWLKKFTTTIDEIPEIVEYYRMSGEVDYLLKIVAPTIGAYDAVYKKLISRVEILEISSHFAMEELKNTTELPLSYA